MAHYITYIYASDYDNLTGALEALKEEETLFINPSEYIPDDTCARELQPAPPPKLQTPRLGRVV
jgi:hypothetical protein